MGEEGEQRQNKQRQRGGGWGEGEGTWYRMSRGTLEGRTEKKRDRRNRRRWLKEKKTQAKREQES